MKITINGNSQLIQANNLRTCYSTKYQGKLATALNENFIVKERKTALKMAIELKSRPNGGG